MQKNRNGRVRATIPVALGLTIPMVAAATGSPVPAQAAATPKDLQIIGRMLSFLDPPMSGQVAVGLVHEPTDKTEAEKIAEHLAAGISAGAVTFVPKLVPADQISVAGVPILLLTVEPSPTLVNAAAKGTIVVSTRPGCADTGACTFSVQSEPKVEITVNRAAAEATGVKIGAAFRMMIKER